MLDVDQSILNEFLNKAHTQSDVLAASTKMHVVSQRDAASIVSVNIGGQAKLDCYFASPHDFAAATSKRHEFCLCSAQRNDL